MSVNRERRHQPRRLQIGAGGSKGRSPGRGGGAGDQAGWLNLEQRPPSPQRAQLAFLLEHPGGQRDRMTTTLLKEPGT